MAKLDVLHSTLEKNLDVFRKELYAAYEPEIHHEEAIDIDARGHISKHASLVVPESKSTPVSMTMPDKLPPVGPFIHSPVQVNQTVYAMKSSLLCPWGKGCVIKVGLLSSPSKHLIKA